MSTIANNRKSPSSDAGSSDPQPRSPSSESGLFWRMVFIDVDADRAEGEALDISHGTAFASPIDIYAGTYDDIANAGIIIITAGVGSKAGGNAASTWSTKTSPSSKRTSSARSARDYRESCSSSREDPVDILTYVSVKLSGLPEYRVIGSAPCSTQDGSSTSSASTSGSTPQRARILGEHGDSS